jgi:hypothetical protein
VFGRLSFGRPEVSKKTAKGVYAPRTRTEAQESLKDRNLRPTVRSPAFEGPLQAEGVLDHSPRQDFIRRWATGLRRQRVYIANVNRHSLQDAKRSSHGALVLGDAGSDNSSRAQDQELIKRILSTIRTDPRHLHALRAVKLGQSRCSRGRKRNIAYDQLSTDVT